MIRQRTKIIKKKSQLRLSKTRKMTHQRKGSRMFQKLSLKSRALMNRCKILNQRSIQKRLHQPLKKLQLRYRPHHMHLRSLSVLILLPNQTRSFHRTTQIPILAPQLKKPRLLQTQQQQRLMYQNLLLSTHSLS
jgi:hypothetical protein